MGKNTLLFLAAIALSACASTPPGPTVAATGKVRLDSGTTQVAPDRTGLFKESWVKDEDQKDKRSW